MAKGDVTLRFDGQTAAFVQAIVAAREKLEAAADSARKFGKDAVKAGDEAESGFKKAADSAMELAVSISGVSTATDAMEKGIEAVKDGFEEYFEKMKQKAEALLGSVEKLNTALGASGQATQAPGVRAALDKITVAGGRLTSPEQVTGDYSAIKRAVGNRSTAQDTLEATRVAETGRAANLDDEAAQRLGINYAQLARERRPGGAFDGYSNDQLADLAYKVTVNMPMGLSDKDLRFFARSRDKNQALNLLFAAGQSDESSKALLSLQNASEAEIAPGKVAELEKLKHQHRRKFDADPENERLLRLSTIAPQDRIQAMLNDPTLAPAESRLAIKSLNEGAGRIPPTRTLQGEIAAQGESQDAAGLLADLNTNVTNFEAQTVDQGKEAAARSEVRKRVIEARLHRLHPAVPNWVAALEAKMRVDFNGRSSWFPDSIDPMSGGANDDLTPYTRELFHRPGPSFLNWAFGDVRQNGGGESHAELKKQTQVLHAISAQLGEQTSVTRTRRDTTLSHNDHQPGAQ